MKRAQPYAVHPCTLALFRIRFAAKGGAEVALSAGCFAFETKGVVLVPDRLAWKGALHSLEGIDPAFGGGPGGLP